MLAVFAGATSGAIEPGRTAAGLGAAFAVEIVVALAGFALCARLGRPAPAHVAAGSAEAVP
jgi:hypothetical protein